MHNETFCDAQAHNFYNTLYIASYIGMLVHSYMHLLKVAFGGESACEIIIILL